MVDRMIGGVATALLPAPVPRALGKLRRILLIRPGGIGDAVLLIPIILALKQNFPEAKITVLAERRNAAAFDLCPAVDHLLRYDTPSELWRAIRGGFDLVIDFEQWHRLSAVVARLTRARVSIGFATNERKRLFTHQIAYSHDDYEALSFWHLLAPLGILPPDTFGAPFLTIPASAGERADTLLATLSETHFVALFPGASIAERRWGAERFRALAAALSHVGIPVVVVGGADDAVDGETIVRGGSGLNLAGRTTLAETAAVVARSALLVSGDSGVLHLAVGLGIPTVSLFGPGVVAKWGPKGEADVVVNHRLPCSPCTRFGTTPPCPVQARCLSEITVTEVTVAVTGLFNRSKREA
jgi:heptosyltransferase II